MWTPEGWYRDARTYAEAHRKFVQDYAQLYVNTYRRHLPEMPAAEITRRVKDFNQQRMDAVPDLHKYPELRGMRELILAEWRGWQEGAGLSDELLAYYTDGLRFYHRFISSGKLARANCSYIFFPTSDHGPLLANNLDSSPDEPFGPPDWPMPNEHVILGGVSSGIYFDEESPEIFPVPVSKLIGRYCRSAREAVEMYQRYNFFWGPGNMLVADRQHQVAMIEKSACRIGVRWSTDGFGFITAMGADEPNMKAYIEDRRAHSIKARNLPKNSLDVIYWQKQDQRRALMNELLDEARKHPTLESMRRFIQFRDRKRGNVCGNGEAYIPDGPPSEHTIRTSIWLLKEGQAQWWAKRDERPSWENRQQDVVYQDVIRWT